MSNFRDRDLLAICNLANLKLEFAELSTEIEKIENGLIKKTKTNHTIYTLLKQELESIKSGDPATRVFYREMGEQPENRSTKVKTPLYGNATVTKEMVEEYNKKVASGELEPGTAKGYSDAHESQKAAMKQMGIDEIKMVSGLLYGYWISFHY